MIDDPATVHRRPVRPRVPRVFAGAGPRMMPDREASGLVLRDLSHTGCAVESDRHFAPDTDLFLTFSIDGCLSFAVPVRVACSRPAPGARQASNRHLVGFEFSAARQPGIHQIVEILLESMGRVPGVH